MAVLRFDIPATVTPGSCSSCRAPIVWIITKAGKRMPVDWDSSTVELDGVRRGVSHFSTCPQADAHRKSRRR